MEYIFRGMLKRFNGSKLPKRNHTVRWRPTRIVNIIVKYSTTELGEVDNSPEPKTAGVSTGFGTVAGLAAFMEADDDELPELKTGVLDGTELVGTDGLP
jgi:hypothetical protein